MNAKWLKKIKRGIFFDISFIHQTNDSCVGITYKIDILI